MTDPLPAIDQVRYERDTARARCLILQVENDRLRELLEYCERAKDAEYRAHYQMQLQGPGPVSK